MDEHQSLPPVLAALGDDVQTAFELAAAAHAHQRRKGDGRPYISHPVQVAEIVHAAGMDEAAVAAALLHDVVEDTPVTLKDLAERFDERTVTLVAAMTEHKETPGYERRKDEHRAQVEASGADAALIYAADKLANLRDLRALYATAGEQAARRFHSSLDLRVELWQRDLEMIQRVAGTGNGHVAELEAELDAFRADRECR